MSEVRLLTSYFLPLTSHPSPLYYHRMTFVSYLFIEALVCVCVCVCVCYSPNGYSFFHFCILLFFFLLCTFLFNLYLFYYSYTFLSIHFVKNQKYRGNLASCQKSPVPCDMVHFYISSIYILSTTATIVYLCKFSMSLISSYSLYFSICSFASFCFSSNKFASLFFKYLNSIIIE